MSADMSKHIIYLIFFVIMSFTGSFYKSQAHAEGNYYYASPGDDLGAKVAGLMPGDTLILNDGVYQDMPLRFENKQGTAGHPIIVNAAHDGKAVIDIGGMRTQQYNPAVFVGNDAAYITIEGIVARNSPLDAVVKVYGTAHDVIIRRVTAYNAGPGNNHVFDIGYGAKNVLVEDCAGWGRGRYIFIAYQASNIIFRRDFGYWENTENFPDAPRGAFSVYNSSNVLLENNIGTHAIPFKPDDNYYTGVWETSNDPRNEPTNNR